MWEDRTRESKKPSKYKMRQLTKKKKIKIKTVVIERRCEHSRQQKVTIEKEM